MKSTARLVALPAFLALALLVPSAAALAVKDLPSYVVLKEEPVAISFSVTNDSGADSAFSFEVLSPAKHEVVGLAPKFLKNGETAGIELRLVPPSGLQGQYYLGKIVFLLGAEKTEKEIALNFLPAESCTIKFSASTQRSGSALALSVTARNSSVEEKTFLLKRLEKAPSDWVAQNAFEARLAGMETKTIDFALSAPSAFRGKGIAVFECAGREAKAEFNADYNGTGSALTGLVAGIGKGGTGNLALNAALFVVAVILVLAFASRYLKRIEGK